MPDTNVETLKGFFQTIVLYEEVFGTDLVTGKIKLGFPRPGLGKRTRSKQPRPPEFMAGVSPDFVMGKPGGIQHNATANLQCGVGAFDLEHFFGIKLASVAA